MHHGTYMDGEPMSDVTIDDLRGSDIDLWKLRVEVKEDAKNVGGCTLFGKSFGNYPQDIKVKIFYS